MSSNKKYKSVLVIDDHKMVVNGIKLMAGDFFEHFYIAHNAGNGMSEALQHFPQLIIVDYSLPDITGDLLVRELRYKIPNAKILAYTFTYSPEPIVKMLQAGVNGYVIKTEDDEEFVQAIHLLMEGKSYFCKIARSHIVSRFSDEDDDHSMKHLIANTTFSRKEIELIKLLCKQMNTKEISGHLNLSARTIEQYRSNIIRRIGAKNVVGVIKFALQNAIIQMDEL